MRAALASTLAIASTVLACPLAAQNQPSDITVTGNREDARSATESVRAISEAVDGVMPRFERPVCPGVVGLPPHLATGVIARMRATIAEAGVDLAAEGCGANLTLIVADDAGELIERLSQESPSLFAGLSAHDMRQLASAPGPAWSWHTTEPKRADGAPVVRNTGGASDTYMVQGAKMSRLTSPIRMDVSLGFVVIGTAAIDGLEVGQIADFAVMRGLAPTRDPRGGAVGYESILELFAAEAPVERMTEFDKAYLSALYSGGNGFTYAQKTRQIAGQVDRASREDR